MGKRAYLVYFYFLFSVNVSWLCLYHHSFVVIRLNIFPIFTQNKAIVHIINLINYEEINFIIYFNSSKNGFCERMRFLSSIVLIFNPSRDFQNCDFICIEVLILFGNKS